MCLLLPLTAGFVLRLGALCRPLAVGPLAVGSYVGFDGNLDRADPFVTVSCRGTGLLKLCFCWFVGVLGGGGADDLRSRRRDRRGGRSPPLLLSLFGAACPHPRRQLLHVRLPLLHLRQDRRRNEDRGVRARHHADE